MTSRNITATLKKSLLGTASLAGALWALASPALAIETVVVTAERRAENLQSVAAAVSAISADRIETGRIQNFDDITQAMPSVSFRSPSPDSGFLSIRGSIASSDGPGQDNGASVYVDDIYANGPGDLPRDFFDLDRIEVLRGPQGTLFGRNVTGGLISFYTKAPTFDFGYGAELTAGDYSLFQGSAYLNAPLSDTLAARINVYGMQRDGYSTSARDPHNTVGDQQVWSVRGQLLFKPNEKFTARLGLEHNDEDSEGPANHMLGDAPFFSDNPVPGTLASYSPRVTNTFEDGSFKRQSTNGFLHADYDMDWATLTSITGYRDSRETEETISFADPGTTLGFLPTPLPIYVISLFPPEKERLWTEEVRLTSPSDQRFTWIAGFYYIDSDRERTEAVDAGLLAFLLGGPAAQNQDVNLKGWSVFGDATYNVTDQFSLTAGARYTSETKDGTTTKNGFFTASGLTESASYSGSWDSVTPRFVASFKPNDKWLIYGLVSRGFKGGGFDFGGDTASTFDDPYQPEHVWNYEAGVRGLMFDGMLRVAANVYRQDYSNLQLRVTSFVGGIPTSVTSNAGSAYSEGLELEFDASVNDWLTLGGNAAFQHAVLTDYAAGGAILHNIPTPNTPNQAFTLYGTALLPILPAEDGGLKLDASITHRGRVWLGATDPFTAAPNYVGEVPLLHNKTGVDALIDASLTWTSPNHNFEIQLWGKNLTDERTVDFGFNWQPLAAAFYGYGGSNFFLVAYSDPRTFGITLRLRE